ncbi:hypothetical protein A4A49_20782 [Nicotiana attenuata]|uniref:Pre-nudix hydrolase domain-containing protein n=1 Tax=Nicotiana attenuata TaxID=49451 RepID=A0A1J6IGG1_NICAT|nr:hypothetical protein A4A49_20782 [Nicotiana attenuata]
MIIKFLCRIPFLSYATTPRSSIFFSSKRHFFSSRNATLTICKNEGFFKRPFYLHTMSSMSCSATPAMAREKEMEVEVDGILAAKEDAHGGVTVEMTNEPLDPSVFGSLLRASLSHWRQQ